MEKIIKGVGVDLSHPDIKKAENIEDLKALDIFSHLSETEQEEAYQELLDAKK